MNRKGSTDNDQVNDLDQRESTTTTPPASTSRRKFLGNAGGAAVFGMAVGAIGLEPLLGSRRAIVEAKEIGPETPLERLDNATNLRIGVAQANHELGIPEHPCNGDEDLYPTKIGSFSKALRHNEVGEVDPVAFEAFIAALTSGRFEDFEALATGGLLGCPPQETQRRLVNPLAGYAFDLEGLDSHQFKFPPAPAFKSAEDAGEMVELYWMSLLRDVNFNNFADSRLALAAAEDLSRLSDFRGPKENGRVTPQTLFRDKLPGATVGPYVSQFLLQPAPYGAQRVDQRIQTARAGENFVTQFEEWLDINRGCRPTRTLTLDGLRFCRNGRDLGQYVHIDALYQAYQVATLVLLSQGFLWDQNNPYGQTPDGGAGLPLPPGVAGSKSMTAFGTFGGPYILALVCEVSTRALKSVWFTKWLVHRRLRPETFGGRVEVVRRGLRTLQDYPIHRDLFDSTVLPAIFAKYNSHHLPLAFPEGSPIHPAYGAGHATVAGACVTILKAFFDESTVIPNPVVSSSDGRTLEPFVGPPLTVGGELNKVASNIATGRNIAGVHWRSDGFNSLLLGEQVAISLLRDQKKTYREPFEGFRLTKFDGTTITI